MSSNSPTEPTVTMADNPQVTVETHISASPDQIWGLISDVNLPAQFSEEFMGAVWLDPPGVGARFEGHNAIEDFAEWTTTSTVTAWQPNHEFAWAVKNPEAPVASWRFLMSTEGNSTRLIFSMTLGPGESYLTQVIAGQPDRESAIITARQDQHRANMKRTIEGIKALAET